jgi:4-hydroxymandelate oxidase
MSDLIHLDDYERAARERLDPGPQGYYASGSDDEITLRENREAWSRLRLLPRVLKGLGEIDSSTSLLGTRLDWPLMVAPMALQRMACEEGECATARAAARAGTSMVLSTISNTAVEEVVAAAGRDVWFQLYVYRDREASRELVQRVEAAGCRALVLTVDVPMLGRREADERNRFTMPAHLELPNVVDRGREMRLRRDRPASALAEYAASQLDPTLSWKDVDWLCSLTSLPVLLKGVLHPGDARLGLDHGAAGIVVSNHGGRQLDTCVTSASALPAIVEAVDGRVPVLADGGLRRGTDVLKALALGADAVLLGRPVLWGLAVGGEDGAARVLELLKRELRLAMALCGCDSLAEVTAALLAADA